MVENNRLLDLLDASPVEAEKKLLALSERLVTYFRRRQCLEPEDMAAETIHRVVQRLSEGVAIDPGIEQFVFGVAKRVLMEGWRSARRKEIPGDAPQARHAPPRYHEVELRILLRQCLQRIEPWERALVEQYYRNKGDRSVSAAREEDGGKERVRVHRVVKKLRSMLLER